ncbi:hypothetical protein [Streptomyces luteireticuli]
MDTRREKVGQVMDRNGQNVWLRPPGGGREWEARAEALRLATPEERHRSGVHPLTKRRFRVSWVGPSVVTEEEAAAPDLWDNS